MKLEAGPVLTFNISDFERSLLLNSIRNQRGRQSILGITATKKLQTNPGRFNCVMGYRHRHHHFQIRIQS